MTEKIVDIEHATSSQLYWRSRDSEDWDRIIRSYKGRTAIDGSSRGIVNKFATCGWAVVQVDVDRGSTPTYGVGAVTLVVLEVQRTIKRAEALWGRGDFLRRQKGGAGLKEAALLTSVLATKMLISGTRLMTALTKDSL